MLLGEIETQTFHYFVEGVGGRDVQYRTQLKSALTIGSVESVLQPFLLFWRTDRSSDYIARLEKLVDDVASNEAVRSSNKNHSLRRQARIRSFGHER